MNFKRPGEPIDPRYERFRDGFKNWIVGRTQWTGLRWAPYANGGEWHQYILADYDFIDFGIIGPPSPLKSEYKFEPSPAAYYWDWAQPGYRDSVLPELWKNVQAKYDAYKAARPGAVWNPWDGCWREMRRKPTPPPSPPAGTPPGSSPDPRDTEYLQRVAVLQADLAAGRITDEIYKARLLELNREYR